MSASQTFAVEFYEEQLEHAVATCCIFRRGFTTPCSTAGKT